MSDKSKPNKPETAKVIPLPKEKEVIALLDDKNKVTGYFRLRRKNKLGVHWVALFQDGISMMGDLGLTGEQWNVWAKLIKHLDFDNYLRVSLKELAEELNMQETHVSRAMKRLKELNIIIEGPMAGRFKTYRLNPYIAHRGTKNIANTMCEWAELKEKHRKKKKMQVQKDDELQE